LARNGCIVLSRQGRNLRICVTVVSHHGLRQFKPNRLLVLQNEAGGAMVSRRVSVGNFFKRSRQAAKF
jgi:hypothetical protein